MHGAKTKVRTSGVFREADVVGEYRDPSPSITKRHVEELCYTGMWCASPWYVGMGVDLRQLGEWRKRNR